MRLWALGKNSICLGLLTDSFAIACHFFSELQQDSAQNVTLPLAESLFLQDRTVKPVFRDILGVELGIRDTQAEMSELSSSISIAH